MAQTNWCRRVRTSDYWMVFLGSVSMIFGAANLFVTLLLTFSYVYDFRAAQAALGNDLTIAWVLTSGSPVAPAVELMAMAGGFILIRFIVWRVRRRP